MFGQAAVAAATSATTKVATKTATKATSKVTSKATKGVSKYKLQADRLNKIAGINSRASVKLNPTKYTGIELQMLLNRDHLPAKGINDFWRKDLRTLKFHNQDLNITVTKITCEENEVDKVPARLIVHGIDGDLTIDCKNKPRSRILSELLELTNPEPVPAEEIPVLDGKIHKIKK